MKNYLKTINMTNKQTKPELIKIRSCSKNTPYVPFKASSQAHCFDIYTPRSFVLYPNQKLKLPLDIQLEIPKGCAAILRERSSSVNNYNITVDAGVIDSDYRGEVAVMLYKKPKIGFFESFKHAYSICKIRFGNAPCWKNLLNRLGLIYRFAAIERFTRNKPIYFDAGIDKIAQLEIVKTIPAKFSVSQKLSKTKRGKGGFGSTGK